MVLLQYMLFNTINCHETVKIVNPSSTWPVLMYDYGDISNSDIPPHQTTWCLIRSFDCDQSSPIRVGTGTPRLGSIVRFTGLQTSKVRCKPWFWLTTWLNWLLGFSYIILIHSWCCTFSMWQFLIDLVWSIWFDFVQLDLLWFSWPVDSLLDGLAGPMVFARKGRPISSVFWISKFKKHPQVARHIISSDLEFGDQRCEWLITRSEWLRLND